MIYGAIWFGAAWLYWLMWATIWLMNINMPVSVTLFLIQYLPTILLIVVVAASVMVSNKRKKLATKPEKYDQAKHLKSLGIITGLIILTVLAYNWLLWAIFNVAR
ncbi:hypothetical protein J5500_04910 [Candidatus Saccharibacteria bacterium]|nr:hypothetical protein [Candidatus Saccharibacteria bacterium]